MKTEKILRLFIVCIASLCSLTHAADLTVGKTPVKLIKGNLFSDITADACMFDQTDTGVIPIQLPRDQAKALFLPGRLKNPDSGKHTGWGKPGEARFLGVTPGTSGPAIALVQRDLGTREEKISDVIVSVTNGLKLAQSGGFRRVAIRVPDMWGPHPGTASEQSYTSVLAVMSGIQNFVDAGGSMAQITLMASETSKMDELEKGLKPFQEETAQDVTKCLALMRSHSLEESDIGYILFREIVHKRAKSDASLIRALRDMSVGARGRDHDQNSARATIILRELGEGPVREHTKDMPVGCAHAWTLLKEGF